MDKATFVNDLKGLLHQHFEAINGAEEILSFGIYSDGDASTIGIYYNTFKHWQNCLKEASDQQLLPLHYLFSMEEWKEDISAVLRIELLDQLNQEVYEFGTKAYERGNEGYKDEVFDLFIEALAAFKTEINLKEQRLDFFVHLDLSDHWIDDNMFRRFSLLLPEERITQYEEYIKNEQYQ